MKLIEMLVEEGSNGWKWPDGTIAITQDKDKSINQYATADGLETNECGTWKYSALWQTYLRLSHEELCLASDWATAIITREQYEAALAAKNEGWIEWGGGECPVPCGTAVDVKHRCGAVSENQKAWPKHHEESDAMVSPLSNAGQAFWRHDNSSMDIIAYRLRKPQEAEQEKADVENDLNECIGQDTAPAWNGEGAIPPVGCMCERSWAGDEWQSCKILFASNQFVVVKLKGSGMEDAYSIGDVTFRPLRTEAECKRDAAIEIMTQILCSPSQSSATAKKIYEAIAAGEIPGVKLEGL